jgi:dihydrofolate synthase/folylpolyglutamate synthase
VTDEHYRATLDRLYQMRRFGMRPGLDVVRALLGGIDHPERAFRAIHVTGSKGKGSVSAIAARILEKAGRTVGLFTSPHLVSYRERIRVNGRLIPRAAVVEGVERLEAASARLLRKGRIERPPTFFELTTVLALGWFRDQRVNDAVVEVGIGGRLDATNVLDSIVGVISTIELEHTDVLGPTLSDIAREKSGIFHRGMLGVTGEMRPEPRGVVDRITDGLGVSVWHLGEQVKLGERTLVADGQRFTVELPGRHLVDLELPLMGRFQPGNAAIAIAAAHRYAEEAGFALPDGVLRAAVSAVKWRGRLERIAKRPETYVDVAHTPDSARSVAESLAEIVPLVDPAESVVLFGCLSDKRIDAILDSLCPLARTIVLAPLRSMRGAPTDTLRRSATGRFPRIVVAPDVATGLTLARAAVGADGLLLATGSDYLVGEVIDAIEGRGDDEPDLSDPGLGGLKPGPAEAPRPKRAPRRPA